MKSPPHPPTDRFEVVWLDDYPKRQKERKIYHSRCKELEQATKQLRVFEEVDKPEFTLWLETEFADLMTSCQSAVSDLSAISRLIELVKCYAQLQKISLSISYEIVEAAKDLAMSSGQSFDEFFADFFAKATGEPFADCSTEDENPQSRSRQESTDHEHTRNPKESKDSHKKQEHLPQVYLKTVYRQLVRLLHPDSNADPSEKSQDLWHEVQAAYNWRDLQRLEQILAALSDRKPRTIDLDVIPISHIMDLRRDVERRLQGLKSRLGSAHKEKAWNFHAARKNKRQLDALRKKINYELEADLRGINSEIARFERQISLWESPRPRNRRRK